MGARKEMIGVDKIDDIRRLGRSGASVASIARDTGVSEPTVRKYLREPDLSERPPAVGRAPGSPLLEPFAGLVVQCQDVVYAPGMTNREGSRML